MDESKTDFSEITKGAIEAALEAGKILKKGFNTSFEITKKEGVHNLVTTFDLKSEKCIISFINENFKDHSILSEEKGKIKKSAEFEWIIDPLDGTVNFAHSIPFFAVSIGVTKNSNIISGVIYNPMLDEMFVAEKSKGSFLNGKKIHVTEQKDIFDSFVATGFPYNLNDNPENCIDNFTKIAKLGLPIRRLGSASLDLAYVASGRFDIFWENILKPWDVAAGILLVEEAGGKISDIKGKKLELKNNISITATNSYLHENFLKILNKI